MKSSRYYEISGCLLLLLFISNKRLLHKSTATRTDRTTSVAVIKSQSQSTRESSIKINMGYYECLSIGRFLHGKKSLDLYNVCRKDFFLLFEFFFVVGGEENSEFISYLFCFMLFFIPT